MIARVIRTHNNNNIWLCLKHFTFDVVYTLLRLLKKAWKVAKVGNFRGDHTWGPDGKIQTAGTHAISQSDSSISDARLPRSWRKKEYWSLSLKHTWTSFSFTGLFGVDPAGTPDDCFLFLFGVVLLKLGCWGCDCVCGCCDALQNEQQFF